MSRHSEVTARTGQRDRQTDTQTDRRDRTHYRPRYWAIMSVDTLLFSCTLMATGAAARFVTRSVSNIVTGRINSFSLKAETWTVCVSRDLIVRMDANKLRRTQRGRLSNRTRSIGNIAAIDDRGAPTLPRSLGTNYSTLRAWKILREGFKPLFGRLTCSKVSTYRTKMSTKILHNTTSVQSRLRY